MKLVVQFNKEGKALLPFIVTNKKDLEKFLKSVYYDDSVDEDEVVNLRFDKVSEVQLTQLINGNRKGWSNDATLDDLKK